MMWKFHKTVIQKLLNEFSFHYMPDLFTSCYYIAIIESPEYQLPIDRPHPHLAPKRSPSTITFLNGAIPSEVKKQI